MRPTPPRPTPGGLRCLTLALILAALALPAHGTSVRRLGLPEMVQRAGHVLLVRALENGVRTDAETLHHYTVTRFEVLESAKGPRRTGDLFELAVIGGHAPGSIYETTVAGAPRFEAGEELILFTRPGRTGGEHILGFFQGVIRLRLDADGNRVLTAAPPDLRPEPVSLTDRKPAGFRRSHGPPGTAPAPAGGPPAAPPGRAASPAVASAPPAGPVKVGDFLDQIRALVAAPAPRDR